MIRRILGVVAALTMAGVGGLTLAAPAQAHHNSPAVSVGEVGVCGEVTLTAAWSLDKHYVGNAALVVEVGGEVQTAAIGETVSVGPFDSAAATTVRYRVWGGGERAYDLPGLLDLSALIAYLASGGLPTDAGAAGVAWSELTVNGCDADPVVEVQEPECNPLPQTVTVTNPEGNAADITVGFNGEAGQTVKPGESVSFEFAGDITVSDGYEETVYPYPPVPGCPGDDGQDGAPGRDGTDGRDGEDSEPQEFVPAGNETDDKGLPVTGAETAVLAGVALALIAAGIGMYLTTRRRRIRFVTS